MRLAAAQSDVVGLDEAVAETVANARALSTRRLYKTKWTVFAEWCGTRGLDPDCCSVEWVLRFLQHMFGLGRSPSTLKGYVSAISSRRGLWGDSSLGRIPMVSQFLRGARRLRPPRVLRAPPWDLALVLGALVVPPYEPLGQADLKALSRKTLFLLALSSARRVGELHALSVGDECMRWKAADSGVFLWPNPFFLPKVLSEAALNQVVELDAFGRSGSPDALLCPVRALRAYVDRTRTLRRGTSQLFVCFGQGRLGLAVSKQRLAHWLVDTIAEAYGARNFPVPAGLVGHSTRCVATSWAALRGVSISDICAAATWSSPCTFARYYSLDVAARPLLATAVLSSGR